MARRAHRHLGLPAQRVKLLAVEGGVWLDVEERAGVWFSAEEWTTLLVEGLGVLAEATGDETLAAAVNAQLGPMSRSACREDGDGMSSPSAS